jgi:hypothetical protein
VANGIVRTGLVGDALVAVSGAPADACRAGELHMQSRSRRTGAAAELAVPGLLIPGERNVAIALADSWPGNMTNAIVTDMGSCR